MTTTNEMNAIIQERARIREAVIDIVRKDQKNMPEIDGQVYIPLGHVLAILTENILEVPQEEKK